MPLTKQQHMWIYVAILWIALFACLSPLSDALEHPPAQTVRLAYLIPSDRQPQLDIDAKFDVRIKATQTFFADEMERHGYGRKTFRFETDADGDAIIHHVTSRNPDEYFQRWAGADPVSLNDYFGDGTDSEKYVLLVAVDVSTQRLGPFEYCGIYGGIAVVAAAGECFNFQTMAHELGHAFGLTHNFNKNEYLMSYGSGSVELSECAAHWLAVNPYFNFDEVRNRNKNTTITLLSASYDTAPPYSLRMRFQATDPDGLHQAQHITRNSEIRYSKYVKCQALQGTTDLFEFATTEQIDVAVIKLIDTQGNMIKETIQIGDIPIPQTENVNIPDPKLNAVIRQTLGLPQEQQITRFGMSRLEKLEVYDAGIRDLTGIQHAIGLQRLYLSYNSIQDITPLASLMALRVLSIEGIGVTDLTPLTSLTQLEELSLSGNRIVDLTPLSKLTQLGVLFLTQNEITDTHALAALTQLRTLYLNNNQVTDITPIASLVNLTELWLDNNQITDITPLAKLNSLKRLSLNNNRVRDVSIVADMVHLDTLVVANNPLGERAPLLTLLHKKPGIEIYIAEEKILPVSLSVFRAEHTDTGVILNWTTESEVDNAGFYIYRSETQSGEFKVVTPSMIQGAGTTGERTEYTWTDTTAKPNTVYYYRIEDVSHAGVREQLATVRLRGLVSATGKLITQWSQLKNK